MEFLPGKVEWHLVRNGRPYGPSSDLEMLKYIELGRLEPTDLLWRDGFSKWQRATAVFPELREVWNSSHNDPAESSIIVGEPFGAARPAGRRAKSRKTLVLALFVLFVLSGAASYAYFRFDGYLTIPGSTSPDGRDATSPKWRFSL
jgi:hypothetical protein